jgi:hypothetical protein
MKLALKILLFVTFPFWMPVLVALVIVGTGLGMIWEGVTSLVEPEPPRGGGKCAP